MMFISVLLMEASKCPQTKYPIVNSILKFLLHFSNKWCFNCLRRARRTLSVVELRRSARKPYRQLNSTYYVALSKTLAIPFASLPAALQIQPVPLTATTPTASSTKAAATGKIDAVAQIQNY